MTTIRLWTYQSLELIKLFDASARVVPEWQPLAGSIRLAYDWMRSQLLTKVDLCTNAPPFWAWYKFNGSRQPGFDAALSLLSEAELERGMALVVFDPPKELTLLSCYETWNQFMDVTIDNQKAPEEGDCWADMFAPNTIVDSSAVQAVLPFIERDWVSSIVPFPIDSKGSAVNDTGRNQT